MEENFFPRKQSAEETNNVIGFKGHGHAERRVFSALFERHCMVYNVYIRLYLSFIVFE